MPRIRKECAEINWNFVRVASLLDLVVESSSQGHFPPGHDDLKACN
jgi:hypothetical protein